MLCVVYVVLWLGLARGVTSLGEKQVVTFDNSGFVLAGPNFALDIILDAQDPAAVHIAAKSFADDIKRITGSRARIVNGTKGRNNEHGRNGIVVGTVGSRLIRSLSSGPSGDGQTGQMVMRGTSDLKGQWESYEIGVQRVLLPGVDEALVIIGSDRVSYSPQA